MTLRLRLAPYDEHERARARKRLRRRLIFVGALGLAVCAASIVVTLTGASPPGERVVAALTHALTIGIPIAVGLYAWNRQPGNPFGKLLVAAGFGWSLTTLAESRASLPYSVGRASLWLVEPIVLYLVLAFPSGRLVARVDRMLVALAIGIVAVLFVPTAFLVDSYPAASPMSGCDTACPHNAFMLPGSTPAFVEPVRTVREALITLLFAAVTTRLFWRIKAATRLVRRTLTPVLAAAIVRFAAYGAFLFARRLAPSSTAVDVLGWLLVWTLPGIALGFLAGLLSWRLHVAEAMERFARRVIARPGRENVESAVAEALEDPTLGLAYWSPGDPGRWVGLDGATVDIYHPGPARAVTRVQDNGEPALAMIHDAALADHQAFVDAAASLALVATENDWLSGRLRLSLRELEESRARIMATADRERLRIERDLHDGAQQRLVALRIKLELADELMDRDREHARSLLHEVESDMENALEEVRSLARGIYPSLLVDQGLEEALRAAALRVPLPTTVVCRNVTRYAAEVESAVYFSCLEALQNAVKHAHASAVKVSIAGSPMLRFEVSDDGRGFDAEAPAGQGLVNMRDRLAAVGGRLTVRSAAGRGTVVSGVVPGGAALNGDGFVERHTPPATHMPAVWRDERSKAIMTSESTGAN